MSENYHKKIIKQYIFNSVLIALFITLLSITLILLSIIENRTRFILPLSCGAFLFYLLCVLEIMKNAKKMIFKDQNTFCNNAAFVLMKASLLKKRGKLKDYNGILINLKNLKYINQRYGVDNGDNVIRLYAEFLDKKMKELKGFAGRIGGDNYYVLVLKNMQNELLQSLAEVYFPVRVDDEIIKIPIRGRFAINELTEETDARSLIFYGMITISECRETHEDIVYYKPEILEYFKNEKKILNEAKYAMKRHEFIPYYQPKVNLETGCLCGCEAFARWEKKGILIPPEQFVPAMEKEGVITDLDFTIFEMVCMDIRNWISMGITPVRVSCNFSKLHLNNPDFVKKIIEIKSRHEIDGKYLEIELTESAGVSDFTLIQKVTKEIKDAGMMVSIDDFGTGYSSLSMLQSIKADVVKIDKSFLDNSFKGDSKQFIIDLINILKHQNLGVVFEGVESEEQFLFLKEHDCDVIQGFYFDKPLTHSEFEKRLINPKYK